jgi:hypothetical protein
MPSDPKECRSNARRCAELAADVREPTLRATLLTLAQSWTRLALELERSQSVRQNQPNRAPPASGVERR